jgi:hypothetical protein
MNVPDVSGDNQWKLNLLAGTILMPSVDRDMTHSIDWSATCF